MNGLTAAIGLETVTYGWNGGTDTLTATITGGPRDSTNLFTVVLNPSTGAYTVTLLDNVLHAGGPNNEATDATAALTYRVTDADGSSATSTLTITFDDDAPSNINPLPVSLLNGSGIATASLDSVDTNTDNNYGADGGTVIFAATLNGQDSGLTSSARKIFYQTSNGGHTLTGYADQNLNGVYDPATDTTAIFTINLNLDKSLAIASDTYTVQMLGRVDSATTYRLRQRRL